MKIKFYLSISLLVLAVVVLSYRLVPALTVQTPPIQISFTCNLTALKCSTYRDLVADGLGCPAGTNTERITCIQTKTVNHLNKVARDQKKAVDSAAAINAAEAAINADFPDQP